VLDLDKFGRNLRLCWLSQDCVYDSKSQVRQRCKVTYNLANEMLSMPPSWLRLKMERRHPSGHHNWPEGEAPVQTDQKKNK
jgi:hypothetical protein